MLTQSFFMGGLWMIGAAIAALAAWAILLIQGTPAGGIHPSIGKAK